MQSMAEAISLSLTFPTVVLAIVVVAIWGPGIAVRAIRSNGMRPLDWLILGVVISFTGAALDNAYWTVPWSLSFVDSEHTTGFVKLGVYFNIFSRQLLGIVAAYCHIRGYIEQNKDEFEQSSEKMKTMIAIFGSLLFGAIYCFLIKWRKP